MQSVKQTVIDLLDESILYVIRIIIVINIETSSNMWYMVAGRRSIFYSAFFLHLSVCLRLRLNVDCAWFSFSSIRAPAITFRDRLIKI